jgi:IS5 family transposase
MARKHGITFRQSYRRVARAARREAARLHHGGKFREAEARVRRLRTWLGRLARDIVRKMAGNAKLNFLRRKLQPADPAR